MLIRPSSISCHAIAFLCFNSLDRLTCEAALKTLHEIVRRRGLYGIWTSSDQQLANCLHFALFSRFPSLQSSLGMLSELLLDSHIPSDRVSSEHADNAKRNGSPSDTNAVKKEARKDNKGPAQELKRTYLSSAYAGAILDWLQRPTIQHGESTFARLIWLPAGAASVESIALLRTCLTGPCSALAEIREGSIPDLSRTTVTSMTDQGHFTLTLGKAQNQDIQQAKGRPTFPAHDLAVLVAIFSGSEVSIIHHRTYPQCVTGTVYQLLFVFDRSSGKSESSFR